MYQADERTVIILGDQKFPHGDAGGNRMEYMAKCLLHEGYQPFIVSLGKNADCDFNAEKQVFERDGILYKNYCLQEGKKGKSERYFKSGKKCAEIVNALELKPGTPIVIYTSNPVFAKQARGKIKNSKNHKYYYDIVEWVDESSFKHGKLNPRYWMFRYCFDRVYPTGSGVIAISKNIKNHFDSLGVPTVLYPICLDAGVFEREPKREYGDKLRFIYPGVPGNKEATDVMLKAILALDEDERKRVELHYTAVKETKIRSLLGDNAYVLDELKDTVTFHKWMEYEELLSLYWSVDALFMVRKNNLITKSNFPSKVPELMACGVTVIANEQGDFFEYLTDGKDAIKIDDISVESCVGAIRKMLGMTREERRALSENALKCANEKFDYRIFSKEFCDYLSR